MNRIAISEHGRIMRLDPGKEPEENQRALTAEQFERLQLWDERTARERGGELLFDWRAGYVKAKQYVGVIQWRDVLIEVLPKVSSEPDDEGEVDNFARGNLRVMLEYAHNLKVDQRGVAQQDHDDAPLSEFLIRLFARQLRDELFKGLPHGYREHEAQSAVLRGKLVLPTHLRTNAARADRFYVRHEEFTADVALNRAFKAAARALVRVASSALTRELLGECVSLLDDVSDVDVRTVRWEGLVLDRKVARFGPALTMARLLTQRQQTTGRQGQSETFALMYPMNALYEQFMAGFLRREVLPLLNEELDVGEEPYELIAQGSGLSERYLFPATDTMKETGLLKPDLMIRRGEDEAVILDTKWKHLTRYDERGKSNARDGISMADLYQMVVYGHVFDSQRVLLVYPEPADKQIKERCYSSIISTKKDPTARVSIETLFVPMGQELAGYPDERAASNELIDEHGTRWTTREWLARQLADRLKDFLWSSELEQENGPNSEDPKKHKRVTSWGPCSFVLALRPELNARQDAARWTIRGKEASIECTIKNNYLESLNLCAKLFVDRRQNHNRMQFSVRGKDKAATTAMAIELSDALYEGFKEDIAALGYSELRTDIGNNGTGSIFYVVLQRNNVEDERLKEIAPKIAEVLSKYLKLISDYKPAQP